MKITEIWPNGGNNKMWEPLHLKVCNYGFLGSNISIQGRTDGRDGVEIRILYKGEQMSRHEYSYHQSLGYQADMARDSAKDINLILEMEEISGSITVEEILPVMHKVRSKCETRYGNKLPDADYEVLVIFD